jgi:hypothetical protein
MTCFLGQEEALMVVLAIMATDLNACVQKVWRVTQGCVNKNTKLIYPQDKNEKG